MREKIYNKYLEIRLWVRRVFNMSSSPFHWEDSEYLDLKEDFKIGMPWGTVHEEYSHQVMEKSSVEYLENTNYVETGEVSLNIVQFNGPAISGGVTHYPEISAGCLYNKIPRRFGTFELEYTLPTTDSTWPSFWLYGAVNWPPEIDMFEFMPGRNRPFGKRKLSISSHSSGEHGGHLNNSSGLAVKVQPRMKMRMEWKPESLKFYHNDLLIKQVTHAETLRQFTLEDQWLIIGTGAMEDYSQEAFNDKFVIHNVKYREL
jgi:hypothetical protein